MPIRAVIENLEDVEESLRSLYKEMDSRDKDSKPIKVFALDLEAVQEHPQVNRLQRAFDTLKREKADLLKKLEDAEKKLENLPEDFDPATFEQMRERLAELEAAADPDPNDPDREKKKRELADLRAMYEQRIANLEKKYKDQLAEKDKEIGKLNKHVERTALDDALTKAMDAVGVSSKFRKAVRAMLGSDAKVVKNGERIEVVVETDLGPQPIDQFAQTWAESDEGREFVEKPRGGDANGSGDKGIKLTANPFDEKTMNLTEQGRIIRANKTEARRLMEAAKWSKDRIEKRLTQQ